MGTQKHNYRRRTAAEIAQLVAEYRRSGLSPTAFCREKGMNRMTLQAYELRQQLASEGTPGKGSSATAVSAAMPTEMGRRRYRSPAEVDRLVAEYEASGLGRREFCQVSGVPAKTLARYVARYRKEQRGGTSPQWIPVEVAAPVSPTGELALVLGNGRRIEVKRDFDAETLRRLIVELERA
jgi:hypothetical protein